MNTQGWIRGIMARNMEARKFLEHVVDCLGMEFELETSISVLKDGYGVKFGDCDFVISEADVVALKEKSPYRLDKYILDQLSDMGFEFDRYRSQYVRYCYELFYRRQDGSVYGYIKEKVNIIDDICTIIYNKPEIY